MSGKVFCTHRQLIVYPSVTNILGKTKKKFILIVLRHPFPSAHTHDEKSITITDFLLHSFENDVSTNQKYFENFKNLFSKFNV